MRQYTIRCCKPCCGDKRQFRVAIISEKGGHHLKIKIGFGYDYRGPHMLHILDWIVHNILRKRGKGLANSMETLCAHPAYIPVSIKY